MLKKQFCDGVLSVREKWAASVARCRQTPPAELFFRRG